jgi:mannose-6-phosphate isomerase-like protein (cupin superfamily)
MKILKTNTAPRYIREEGIVSYLLTSAITSESRHLTTTFVEIKPNGKQRIHHHDPEQIYFILEGSGLMTVENETERVSKGDCIFIPSEAPHGLENDSDMVLKYFSAASPMFESNKLKSFWPLKSEAETNK